MKHVVTRTGLQEQLANTANQASCDESYAILLADVSGLVKVREDSGPNAHAVLLQRINQMCEMSVRRNGDVVARCGDNRFALLLERCPSKQALQAARMLRATVQRFRFYWKDHGFCFSVSIGVVPNVHRGSDAALSLEAASIACDKAKRRGSNGIEVYAEGDAAMSLGGNGIGMYVESGAAMSVAR